MLLLESIPRGECELQEVEGELAYFLSVGSSSGRLYPTGEIGISIVGYPVVNRENAAQYRFVFSGQIWCGGFSNRGLVRCILPATLIFDHRIKLSRPL